MAVFQRAFAADPFGRMSVGDAKSFKRSHADQEDTMNFEDVGAPLAKRVARSLRRFHIDEQNRAPATSRYDSSSGDEIDQPPPSHSSYVDEEIIDSESTTSDTFVNPNHRIRIVEQTSSEDDDDDIADASSDVSETGAVVEEPDEEAEDPATEAGDEGRVEVNPLVKSWLERARREPLIPKAVSSSGRELVLYQPSTPSQLFFDGMRGRIHDVTDDETQQQGPVWPAIPLPPPSSSVDRIHGCGNGGLTAADMYEGEPAMSDAVDDVMECD